MHRRAFGKVNERIAIKRAGSPREEEMIDPNIRRVVMQFRDIILAGSRFFRYARDLQRVYVNVSDLNERLLADGQVLQRADEISRTTITARR